MKDIINELIKKYQKEWDKHGMGSGISYSKLIADLEEASKQCNIANVRHSTSRKGTGWYMIFITALCGLLGGMGWYHVGIEVGIFTLLILIIAFLASIRYNQ